MNKKGQLTAQELTILQIELEKQAKNPMLTYVLWWFLGLWGGHRFYLGQTGYAVAMLLFAWATCGIWWIIDVFFVGKNLNQVNAVIEDRIINEILANRS